MKIDIICSDEKHPIMAFLENWVLKNKDLHEIRLVNRDYDIDGGDILFLLSCSEIIDQKLREKYLKCFVMHASDLPKGRGWSPHIWQILDGKRKLCLSLLEADDPVDTGKIWKKENIEIPAHFDFEEICQKLFSTEIRLIDFAIDAVVQKKNGYPQVGEASYFPKRNPSDSRLNIHLPIIDQFDLLRVSDPERYPAFLNYLGYRYQLSLKKVGKIEDN